MSEQERCLCAAVQLPDGRIVPGYRHADAMRTAHGMTMARISSDMQGFLTTLGRFVGREEGLRLQQAAGIQSVSRHGYHLRELFSEDLY